MSPETCGLIRKTIPVFLAAVWLIHFIICSVVFHGHLPLSSHGNADGRNQWMSLMFLWAAEVFVNSPFPYILPFIKRLQYKEGGGGGGGKSFQCKTSWLQKPQKMDSVSGFVCKCPSSCSFRQWLEAASCLGPRKTKPTGPSGPLTSFQSPGWQKRATEIFLSYLFPISSLPPRLSPSKCL